MISANEIKRALGAILLYSFAMSSLAQEYSSPTLESAHTPVQALLFDECSLLSFFYVGSNDDRHVEIYSLRPEGSEGMQFVGAIPQEGGPPVVESVVLINVDADPEREVLVLARWNVNHAALNTSGSYYRTYAYDQQIAADGTGLKRLEGIEKRIGEGFDGISEGEPVSFPIKTAEEVKRVLGKG